MTGLRLARRCDFRGQVCTTECRPAAVPQTLVNEELKQYFRPEFLNRLDEIIVFRQLSKAEVKEIADIMLKEVCAN